MTTSNGGAGEKGDDGSSGTGGPGGTGGSGGPASTSLGPPDAVFVPDQQAGEGKVILTLTPV
jgi:hypothetical protein